MFETLFTDYLNPDHELFHARLIEWDDLHDALYPYYSPLGRSGKAVRLMVGLHILKHRYSCSDERAVEELQENAYWQYFCGFHSFQRGSIVDATSLVKFRKRIGPEGMKKVESVFLKHWTNMGLVKTKRVAVDTTAQPKNIAYPTDADLLHKVREKIVKEVKRVRQAIPFRKPFRSFSRRSKQVLLKAKKFYRKNKEAGKASLKDLKTMTDRVVRQTEKIVNSLYSRGNKDLGRKLYHLVSVGSQIVFQTDMVLAGLKPKKRLYSHHERRVAAIRKGKAHPSCEFGSLVSLSMNDDGLILSHREYQDNVSDIETMRPILAEVEKNTGKCPNELTADRGFSQSMEKQKRSQRRWGIQRVAIPKKGKHPHPDSDKPWFKKALKQRAKIEPVIGHLKNDHRMNRCRYKGDSGDTANVVWATLAWNTKKITQLHRKKVEKQNQRAIKRAV